MAATDSDFDSDFDLSTASTNNEASDKLTNGAGGGAGDADINSTSNQDLGADPEADPAVISEKASSLKEHDVPEEETAEAAKVKSDLDKELRENDGWLKILGNDEIMKKITKEGVAETRPLRGEICTIRIEGKLASDESVVFEFQEKFTFQLGDVEVITGLDMAIPLMCKGEVSTIKVSPRFAFGSKGLSPKIPPNAHLIYEVELIDFENEKDLTDLSVGERRDIGNRKRERGNFWYGRGESSLAIQCYRRALEFLDEAEGGIQFPNSSSPESNITDELRELFDDRIKTLNNMAQAQLKLQAYEPALNSVDAVLKCQPNNVKALFRKGKILGEKMSTNEALEILQTASRLEPDNKAIQLEIAHLTKRKKKEHTNEKLLYKRMFKDSTESKSSSSRSTEDDNSSSYRPALTIGLVLTGFAVAAAGVLTYRYRFL